MASVQQRIILGLKVRQFRQEKGWNFEELSRQTGISVSYLNEIEKGRKYPMAENQDKLSKALGISTEFLTSAILTKQNAPLGELLQSNFLNEIPLELFGIELQQVVEIIAKAPDRVNAFISAMLEIARNYSLRDENFFFAALRAYQELHMNYFDDIENLSDEFVEQYKLPLEEPVTSALLQKILINKFGYSIDEKGLTKYPELQEMRSVFVPKKRILLLNPNLSAQQRTYQLAKEIGFNVLHLKERPLASSMLQVKSFEETLNNYKAGYFAVNILVNRETFAKDLTTIFNDQQWNPEAFLQLIARYDVSPEVLFQRFNVLSKEFGLHKIFFFRTMHHVASGRFEIDKELHLNRRHQPHASGLNEHYCRRWLSLSLLEQLALQQASTGDHSHLMAGAQCARFADTGEEYLCVAVAKPGTTTQQKNVSVMIGILLDDAARKIIRFHSDPQVPQVTVNVTCERCAIMDCQERSAPPVAVERREKRKRAIEVLKKVTG